MRSPEVSGEVEAMAEGRDVAIAGDDVLEPVPEIEVDSHGLRAPEKTSGDELSAPGAARCPVESASEQIFEDFLFPKVEVDVGPPRSRVHVDLGRDRGEVSRRHQRRHRAVDVARVEPLGLDEIEELSQVPIAVAPVPVEVEEPDATKRPLDDPKGDVDSTRFLEARWARLFPVHPHQRIAARQVVIRQPLDDRVESAGVEERPASRKKRFCLLLRQERARLDRHRSEAIPISLDDGNLDIDFALHFTNTVSNVRRPHRHPGKAAAPIELPHALDVRGEGLGGVAIAVREIGKKAAGLELHDLLELGTRELAVSHEVNTPNVLPDLPLHLENEIDVKVIHLRRLELRRDLELGPEKLLRRSCDVPRVVLSEGPIARERDARLTQPLADFFLRDAPPLSRDACLAEEGLLLHQDEQSHSASFRLCIEANVLEQTRAPEATEGRGQLVRREAFGETRVELDRGLRNEAVAANFDRDHGNRNRKRNRKRKREQGEQEGYQ
jgi:hypothetical protein